MTVQGLILSFAESGSWLAVEEEWVVPNVKGIAC